MVGSPATGWPVVVVAAKGMLRDWRSGMRKVAVQPAPRIRRLSSSMAGYEDDDQCS
jgi:hypothetical protein